MEKNTLSPEAIQKEIDLLKEKRASTIRLKYHPKYKSKWVDSRIIDHYTAKIREMEAILNQAC